MLWKELQRQGVKLGRQILIMGWIADFYDPVNKIVIELDGPFHIPAKDAYRDRIMRGEGYTVLRYPNTAVFGCVRGVVREIREYLD